MSVHFQALCHQTAARNPHVLEVLVKMSCEGVQGSGSTVWWCDSLLTTAGLNWASRWNIARWWWGGLALRQTYQREISSPRYYKSEVLICCWAVGKTSLVLWFSISVLQSLVTIVSSICLVKLSRFSSLFMFCCWLSSQMGSFLGIYGNYSVKYENIIFTYL